MFWKFLAGLAKGSFYISRSATAIGAAVVITVGVYDFLKARREQPRRRMRWTSSSALTNWSARSG